MRRESEVPAGQALVEKREKRLRALTEDTNPDGVDVGDDLRRSYKSVLAVGRWTSSTHSIDDDGESTSGIEAGEGVRLRRRVALKRSVLLGVARLGRNAPIGSVWANRAPLLVLVGLVLGWERCVVVSLVDGSCRVGEGLSELSWVGRRVDLPGRPM